MPDNQPDLFEPRGIRNNNPGNIRSSSTFVWRGQSGADRDGFCKFDAAVWGIRAICLLWTAYQEHHNCKTLRDYISRWAPTSENDTTAYVWNVAHSLGVDPDAPLDIHAEAPNIVAAIIRYENGEQPYTLENIRRGLTLANER